MTFDRVLWIIIVGLLIIAFTQVEELSVYTWLLISISLLVAFAVGGNIGRYLLIRSLYEDEEGY
jgi:hypothetical protein